MAQQLPGFISDDQMSQLQQQQSVPTDLSAQPGFISDEQMKEQARPKYASGLSELTPINESPISGWDRLKMSAGQVGGSMSGTVKALQQQGYEVKRNKQNEIVLKDPKDGLWKMFDAKDPWSASRSIMENIKEIGADIMEVIPDVATGVLQEGVAKGIQAAAVASAVASGGTSIPASVALFAGGQAAGALAATAAKTVMGKLAGTYEANPEDDFIDLQRETLMNLGGGIIGAGVAPTAKVIGKGLEKLSKSFPKTDDVLSSGLAKVFGSTTGVGEDAIQYGFRDQGFDRIGKNLAEFKNLPTGAIKDELKRRQVDLLAEAAPESFKVLRRVYAAEEKAVLESVKAYAGEAVEIEGKQITQAGLAAFDNLIEYRIKDMPNTLPMDLSNALKYGLDKVQPVVKSNEILVDTIGANLSDKARNALGNFSDGLMNYQAIKKTGVAGAEWAMVTTKNLKASIDSFEDQLLKDGVTDLQPFIRQLRDNLDVGLSRPLDKLSNGRYGQYLNNYREASAALEPYTSAVKSSKSSNNRMAAYETLANRLNSRAGSNVYAKGAGDELSLLATKYAPGLVDGITSKLQAAELHAVTSKFADWVRPGLIGQTSATVGLGGAITMNPIAMASAAAGAAASSPRLAMKVTPTLLKAARQTKAVASLAGNKLAKLAEINPAILQQFVETPFRTAAQEEQVKQQLGSAIQQQGGVTNAPRR